MNAQQAFVQFAQKYLLAEKARRFTELSLTKKGQQKILASLYHEFERAIRSDAARRGNYDGLWKSPCFVFEPSLGFGAEFSSVRQAYDQLSVQDSWLILLCYGSAGIYRP
jgi:hypothetical protein